MPKHFQPPRLPKFPDRAELSERAARARDAVRDALPGRGRPVTRAHKRAALAGVGALSAATLAFTLVPSGGTTTVTDASSTAAPLTYSSEQIKDVKTSVTDQLAGASLKVEAIEAKQKAAAAKKQSAAEAKKQAVAERQAEQSANRSAPRAQTTPVAAKNYANNLDGWIRESLDIMKNKGIPGSYNGLHRNILRESSGNPNAINNWDINAINGVPSKGLLQVIPPTFDAYHVSGTPKNIWHPVSNIVAAANYAADRYGSIDNVFGAY
ncbi:transglycosylase SLT domain-containing protein [Streptomyces sp. NPDC091377]|uniref:transglycosylase SLT domain-containing protein n=1 Tax=Streptomyces sp. NPDC091377 TaxID=3365995 RepID=UPI0038004F72